MIGKMYAARMSLERCFPDSLGMDRIRQASSYSFSKAVEIFDTSLEDGDPLIVVEKFEIDAISNPKIFN
ncbi:hypothetical protein DYGSA30_31600 [Dyella sp. GSA-30]|nr:hypothetical protein DYGSA30_31600 [Dyella sp. GSA-30]